MTDVIEKGRWFPQQPPKLLNETDAQYTDRLTGADGTARIPYDHKRNRQCSIGWHNECSDRSHSGTCGCPCHGWRRDAKQLVDVWNRRHKVGVRVILPQAPEEPATVTTSAAYIGGHPGIGNGWPVVDLEGWDHPVELAWLEVAR